MIEISYKTLDGTEKKKPIPIHWRDLTWAKFVELSGKKFNNEIERLAFVTGIESEILLANPLFLAAVIESSRFVWDTPIEDYTSYIKKEYSVQIKDQDWGKFEAAKSAIQVNPDNLWASGAEIVKLYLDIDINDKPCVDVIGLVGFFLPK
jgi:hypothetical protein